MITISSRCNSGGGGCGAINVLVGGCSIGNDGIIGVVDGTTTCAYRGDVHYYGCCTSNSLILNAVVVVVVITGCQCSSVV